MNSSTEQKGNEMIQKPKTYVTCFDCGESTASPLSVYRMLGPVNDLYQGPTFVHRGGQGCHKGQTTAEVREMPEARTR